MTVKRGTRSLKLDYNNKPRLLMNGGAVLEKSGQMKSIVINNMKWIESITKREEKETRAE